MTGRLITLSVVDMRYEGDAIGRDLSLVVELGGGRLEINKRIRAGECAQINRPIAQFWAEGNTLALLGLARVTERDPVYNDLGEAALSWNLNAEETGLHQTECEIIVAESGGRSESASARFLVKFQAHVAPTRRYISKTEKGWVKVQPERSSEPISLPEALSVEIIRTQDKREYFRINEGPLRGQLASVKLKSDGTSWLSTANPHQPAIQLIYSLSGQELRLGNHRYQCIGFPGNALSKGDHDIEIPDAPHPKGLKYPQSKRATTWFRIDHRDDKYIHVGQFSLGCVTVKEIEKWDELASKMVKSRKGDGVSIGTLKVVD